MGRIDPATGRNKRDGRPLGKKGIAAPKRENGHIVPKGKLNFQRDKKKR
jgi:hypothetical protein